jgi:hypothetical protein
MQSTSPDQREENLRKTYLRHYHMASQSTIIIDSKSRLDRDIQQRRRRDRLTKWSAIGLLLVSLVLAGILLLSKQA